MSYKNCKFGTFCKYFHDSTPFENDDKYERDSILERIEKLQKEITDLTNSILEMKENLQTIYKESLYEILKCNECGKTFKSKAGLKAHVKGHQKLVQLDGNVSFIEDFEMMDESENNSTVNTEACDETTKKSIYEIRLKAHRNCSDADIIECFTVNVNCFLEQNNIMEHDKSYTLNQMNSNILNKTHILKQYKFEIRNDDKIEEVLNTLDPINYKDGINWDDLCFENSVHGEIGIT